MPLPLEESVPFDVLANEPHHTTVMGAGIYVINFPKNSDSVLVQALTQNIRFTLTGTDPTSGSGFQLKAGDPPLFIKRTKYMTLKMIRETSGAVLEHEFGE